ncbi:MAG: GDSL family lipase [Chlorobi bacterium]|nr:GDSL family lipase [Chlorobiota bacterium]
MKKKIRVNILFPIASLFLFMAVSSFTVPSANRRVAPPDTLLYKKNVNYQHEIDLYKINKIKQADIVMLGNSLTHGANWNELLGRKSVIERGIVSDVVEGFYHRMSYVYKLNPKIVFVLGGLNDIFSWVPVEEIYKYYVKIINGLKSRRIIPVIQSTLYAGKSWGKAWIKKNHPELNVAKYNAGRNDEVDKLNRMLKNFARVNKIDFIDLNPLMSRGHYLKPELTYDGVHLKAAGYKIWAKEVDKVLRKHKL